MPNFGWNTATTSWTTTNMKAPKTLKLRAPNPSEAEVQRAVIRRLVAGGWLTVRINGGGGWDKAGNLIRTYIIATLNAISGFPDVLALKGDVRGGRFLLIEVKTAKGTLTDSQKRFALFAKKFGITVHVVRSPDELDAIWAKERPFDAD